MDIDNLFVNKVLLTSGDDFRMALRLVPKDMVQGEARPVYAFIRDYYRESKGSTPSRNAIKKKFSHFAFSDPKDTIQFYVSEIRDRQVYETMTTSLTGMQNALFAKDLPTAREELRKLRVDLADISLAESETARKGFSERWALYLKAKKNKGIIGLQTGIKAIDRHIGGIQDEYFIIVGRRGMGKTFCSLMFLKEIWPQMEGPLVYVTNEMSATKILARLDSVEGGFSYSRYRKGLLTDAEEQRLKSLPTRYAKYHDLHVISGAGKSADDVEYEMVAIEPAAMFVDGLYLTDMGFNDPFRDTLGASRAYQRMSKKYNIPIIATTQLSDTNETKYARGIEEDADIVMRLYQSHAMRDDKVMGIDFLKIREEASDLKAWMKWDFDAWDFSEADYSKADGAAEQEYEEQ
jgi:replicative DNA helicase